MKVISKSTLPEFWEKHPDAEGALKTCIKISEFLSRQRPLSIAMMRRLYDGLRIPAEVLLREPGAKIMNSI
jgi:mRNA-degrading endonuclease HigB of HigAB toxin-antitoxin module